MYIILYIIILISLVNCETRYKLDNINGYLNEDRIIYNNKIYEINGDNITIIPFNNIQKQILNAALDQNYISYEDQKKLIISSAEEITREELNVKSKIDWYPTPKIYIFKTKNGCTYPYLGHCTLTSMYTLASSHFNFDNFILRNKHYNIEVNANSTEYMLPSIYIGVSWHVFDTNKDLNYLLNNYYSTFVYNMILIKIINKHLNDKVVLLDNENIKEVTTPLKLFEEISSNNEETYSGIDYFTGKLLNLSYSSNMIENRQCLKLYISGTMYLCDVNHNTIYKFKIFDIFKLTKFRCLNKGNFDYCTPFYNDINNSTYPIYMFYNGEIYYDTYVFDDNNYSDSQLNLFKEYKNCDLIKRVDNKILCLIIPKMIDRKIYFLTLVNNIKEEKNREIPINNFEVYDKNLKYPNCSKIKTCKYNDFIESKIRMLLHNIGFTSTKISVKLLEILEITNYMEKNNICSELITNIEKLLNKQILFKIDPSLTELLNDLKNLGEMTCKNETSTYIRNKYYNIYPIESINIKKRSISECLNLKKIKEVIHSEVEKKIKEEYVSKIYVKKIQFEEQTNCPNDINYYVLLYKFKYLKYCVNTLIKYQNKFYYPKNEINNNNNNCINL
jgi:hypothetical protein